MSSMTYPTLLACGAAILLAACGQPEPSQMPFARQGVEFTLAQVGDSCSDQGAYTGKVSWQVPESLTSHLEVQVSQKRRQIFTRSNERVGSEKTGPWVKPGLEFYLLDRDNEILLAAFRAGPGQCNLSWSGAE